MVIKKDGRREPFQREKLLGGLLKSCEKRPVSTADIENLVEEIEKEVKEKFYDEVSSGKIGEIVMRSLRRMDDIAYVRFASVYRQFTDVDDFLKEVQRFSHTRRRGK